jgi:hypothetical protein
MFNAYQIQSHLKEKARKELKDEKISYWTKNKDGKHAIIEDN